jgi:hypothetical protein
MADPARTLGSNERVLDVSTVRKLYVGLSVTMWMFAGMVAMGGLPWLAAEISVVAAVLQISGTAARRAEVRVLPRAGATPRRLRS